MCKNEDLVDETADACFERLRRRIMARREVLSHQGAIVASWRTYRGKRLGPYYRIAFREGGRQVSIHLGRRPEVIGRVRALVAEIQAPRELQRAMRRATAAGKAALRASKARSRRLMAECGLYTKGWSVFARGRRTAPAGRGKEGPRTRPPLGPS